MGRFIDLTGQKFGRLTVIRQGKNIVSPTTNRSYVAWLCLCDCQLKLPTERQKLKLITGESLRSGKIKSCGCLHQETARENGKKAKKYNVYDVSGNYGIGWTINTNAEFYFDLEDYDKIKNYCWNESTSGYIETVYKNKRLGMHRIIMGVVKFEDQVDHIHGTDSIKDNRKNNLRIVNNSQNQMNKQIQQNNTSGVTGVFFHRVTNKWAVQININGKQTYLGEYEDFDEAVKIRKEAEEKYFGEFSYDNSQAI